MKGLYESILGSTGSGEFRFSDIKEVEFYSDEKERYKKVFHTKLLTAYANIKHNYVGTSFPKMFWFVLCDLKNTGKTYAEVKSWLTKTAKNGRYVNDSKEVDDWLKKLIGKYIKTIISDVRFFVSYKNDWISIIANYDGFYNCQIVKFKL